MSDTVSKIVHLYNLPINKCFNGNCKQPKKVNMFNLDGTLNQTFRVDEFVPVNYSWTNPTSSTSAISLNVVDQYGISSTFEINYGGVQTQPDIQLLSATNFINQYI